MDCAGSGPDRDATGMVKYSIWCQQALRISIAQSKNRSRSDGSWPECIGQNEIVHEEWWVESEHPFATLSDRVTIEHAVRATDHPAGSGRIRKPEPWSPIIAVGLDKGAIESAAVLRKNHCSCSRIKVGKSVVFFHRRRRIFVAQTNIQSKCPRHLKIILHEREVQSLALVDQRQ